MEPLAVNLFFDPPAWPIVLRVCAVLGLAWEFAVMARRAMIATASRPVDDRGPRPNIVGGLLLAALALATGPVLALSAAVFALATYMPGRPRRGVKVAVLGLQGTLVGCLAATVWLWSGPGQIGAVVALGVLGAVWAIRAYARTTSPIKAMTKAGLLFTRLAVVALLIFWASGPTLKYVRQYMQRGKVLILIDSSSSMTRRDIVVGSGDPIRRCDAMRSALGGASGDLDRLNGRADVEWFLFDAKSRRLSPVDRDRENLLANPTGKATAIGDAAADALNAYAGQNVQAMLVVSDGCNNTADFYDPAKFADLMADRSMPIYTIGVGSITPTRSTRNLSVRDLSSADEVDVFTRLPIRVRLETLGLAGRKVQVTCKLGDTTVGIKDIDVSSDQVTQALEFEDVPLKAGSYRLSVTTAVVGEKPVGLGGQMSVDKLVHVVDRELRLLYIEGKIRYESKFIAAALVASNRFKVDRRVIVGAANRGPAALGEDINDWLPYHAIIFGDLRSDQFTPKQLDIVRKLVDEYGKGFCMIGGANSFGRGGWADTPIADLLPVDLAKCGEQIDQAVQVVPVRDAVGIEMLRIGQGADPLEEWGKLPPLSGANKLVKKQLAGIVLAADAGGNPLIVQQQFGKGRALAIAFDTTWNWTLTPKDTGDVQQRFWRQVGLFLANPRGNLWINTDKTSYDLQRLGRGVYVTAGAEDSKGQSITDTTQVQVKLIDPDGSAKDVPLLGLYKIGDDAHNDAVRTPIEPPTKTGVYTLRITATVDGKPLTPQPVEHQFSVVARDIEALDVLADYEQLKSISQISRGEFDTLDHLRATLARIEKVAQPKSMVRDDPRKLAEDLSWPIIITLISLLCLEWSIRKRIGLV